MNEEQEINFYKLKNYEKVVRFLMKQIEDMATDGDDFELDKIREHLFLVDIDMDEEYFQP